MILARGPLDSVCGPDAQEQGVAGNGRQLAALIPCGCVCSEVHASYDITNLAWRACKAACVIGYLGRAPAWSLVRHCSRALQLVDALLWILPTDPTFPCFSAVLWYRQTFSLVSTSVVDLHALKHVCVCILCLLLVAYAARSASYPGK